MVSMLPIGAVLTASAWLDLQITVFHGKYVTEKITAGKYNKGPLRGTGGEPDG